ncbi:hypothetical protein PM082_000032 [Marasmius tenuissimus]|nr:hypothetical protein PM082_000032 [Marasmius tenuissimus]
MLMAVNNDDMGGSKSRIQGNASEDVKRRLGNPSTLFMTKDRDGSYKSLGYSMEIFRRLEVTEISFEKHPEEPSKRFSRVVCELDVEPDMANNEEHLHGACSAYLVDMCTNIVILAYQLSTKKEGPSVSKSINTLYHSPALLGDRLRIVSTTLAVGERTMTARIEIWNATRHRLVASGEHTKMSPSTPTPRLDKSKSRL